MKKELRLLYCILHILIHYNSCSKSIELNSTQVLDIKNRECYTVPEM